MPAMPSSTPARVRRLGRGAPGRSAPKTTIQIGTVAMISAARPEGISCSAQVTPPLPPTRSSAPMIKALRQWMRCGAGAPRQRCQP